MVAQSSAYFPIFRGHAKDSVEEVFVLLHKLLGELQFPLLKNI